MFKMIEKNRAEADIEIKCPGGKKMISRRKAVKNKYVCYECGMYFRVRTHNRIRMVADPKSFIPWFEDLEEKNPLHYEGYEDKLEQAKLKSGVQEAVTIGECKIFARRAVVGVCDAQFLMGSMGQVVGEKITASIERATELSGISFLLFGRSQNAGRDHFPDADGEDGSGDQEAWGEGTAVCDNSHGSHNRWCHGELCHAGGYYHGRAGSTDRFCGS